MDAPTKLLTILDLLGVDRSALPPGASEASIEAFEHHVGARLPDALRRLYLMHDGEYESYETPDSPRIFFDYGFLPLIRARSIYDTWAEIRDSFEKHGIVEDFLPTCRPEDSMQCAISHEGWIPFAGCHGHLALDFAPGPSGVAGQVINFGRDDELHVRLASTFDDFLDLVIERYKERQWHESFGRPNWTALYDELRRDEWHG